MVGDLIGPGTHDRALAYNIALFFGTIIMGFLLAVVFEPPAQQMLDIAADGTTRESATRGQNYVRYAFSNLHLLVISFGLIQLIVAAVYEANVGGGGIR